MRKTHLLLSTVLATGLVSMAYAVPDFQLVFNEAGGVVADTAEPVRGSHVVAGVDTDGDGNQEIVYMRIVGGTVNEAQVFIFENDGDNSYNLAYSTTFPVKGTPVNGTLGALLVADADDTAGDEIYVFASGPTAAAGDSCLSFTRRAPTLGRT